MDKQTALIEADLMKATDDCYRLSQDNELLRFECELTQRQRDYWIRRAVDMAVELALLRGKNNV